MSLLAHSILVVAGVARSLDGMATRRALLAAGLTSDDVATLLDIRHLRRVLPGIYVVAADRLTHRQVQRTALLLAPERCWLSARSSLETRSVLWPRIGQVTVHTTARLAARELRTELPLTNGLPGRIVVRKLVRKPPRDCVDDLAVTSVPRALVDLAAREGTKMLRIAWREAEFRGLLDRAALDAELAGPRRPGHDALRKLVDSRRILTEASTDLRSKAELLLLHLIAEAGLPLPEVNVRMTINGVPYVADFFWAELGLVLELDSPDHLLPVAGARDRVRDTDFFVAGIDVVRFLDSAVVADPAGYMSRLDAILTRQASRARRAA